MHTDVDAPKGGFGAGYTDRLSVFDFKNRIFIIVLIHIRREFNLLLIMRI